MRTLLQRPGQPALTREAADRLRLHGSDWDGDWDGVAAELTRRAEALKVG